MLTTGGQMHKSHMNWSSEHRSRKRKHVQSAISRFENFYGACCTFKNLTSRNIWKSCTKI